MALKYPAGHEVHVSSDWVSPLPHRVQMPLEKKYPSSHRHAARLVALGGDVERVGHAVQMLEPLVEYVPAAQPRHDVAPVELRWPAGQTRHAELPCLLL